MDSIVSKQVTGRDYWALRIERNWRSHIRCLIGISWIFDQKFVRSEGRGIVVMQSSRIVYLEIKPSCDASHIWNMNKISLIGERCIFHDPSFSTYLRWFLLKMSWRKQTKWQISLTLIADAEGTFSVHKHIIFNLIFVASFYKRSRLLRCERFKA